MRVASIRKAMSTPCSAWKETVREGRQQSKAGGAARLINNGWCLQQGHDGCVVMQSQRQSEIPRQVGDNTILMTPKPKIHDIHFRHTLLYIQVQ